MSFTPIPPEMRDGFERLPGLTLPLEPLRHSSEGTREGNRNRSVHQLSAYPRVNHDVSSAKATVSGDREQTTYLGPPSQARNSSSRQDSPPTRAKPSDSHLAQPVSPSDLGRNEDASTANVGNQVGIYVLTTTGRPGPRNKLGDLR